MNLLLKVIREIYRWFFHYSKDNYMSPDAFRRIRRDYRD